MFGVAHLFFVRSEYPRAVSAQTGLSTHDEWRRTGFAMGASAVLYSLTPLIVHLTAKNINPFYYNSIYLVAHSTFILGVLLIAKRYWVRESIPSAAPSLSSLSLWGSYFHRSDPADGLTNAAVTIRTMSLRRPVTWLKSPLFWLFFSNFQYAFFAWSSQLVETAIASTIYELWPAIVVYGLVRHHRTDKLHRTAPNDSTMHRKRATAEQKTLTLLASVGLVLMLGSQAGESLSSPLDLLSLDGTIGILLAIVACILGALNVLSSLALGEIVYYRVVDGSVVGPRGG